LDCIALYQILEKFNQLIWLKFKINIGKFPTIPSLTFNLFISKYLKKDTIHMLSGEVADRIRLSYSGGAVDMYLTKLIRPKTKKVYAYDVNALYPYVMSVNEFPIGNPTYFKGDILKFNPNAFGFFYCKISVPSYKQHPILQTRIKTTLPSGGVRSIFPTGDWEGMYFSQELLNAKKYGYKFEVLWGYTFKKGYIFKDYVDTIYNIRLTYNKSCCATQ
jgi:hypothetical protein